MSGDVRGRRWAGAQWARCVFSLLMAASLMPRRSGPRKRSSTPDIAGALNVCGWTRASLGQQTLTDEQNRRTLAGRSQDELYLSAAGGDKQPQWERCFCAVTHKKKTNAHTDVTSLRQTTTGISIQCLLRTV